MKKRIVLLFFGFVVLFSVLILRAAWLQIWPNTRLKSLQQRQFQTVVTLQSRRGLIVDRDGRELAASTSAYSLYADPKLIPNRKLAAKKIAKELGVSVESIYSKIKDPTRRFVWLQRRIEKDKVERIKDFEIRGISSVEEYKRVYPNENLLSQVLGFIGNEGNGLEGLELSFEEELKGSSKKVSVRRDARGRPLVADGLMFTENQDGAELRLTIDSEMQYMLETELARAIGEFDADNAVGVVLDAKTSEILAMASAPVFDANKSARLEASLRRNRAITDIYEPGSTIKTFAIATGLRDKVLTPNKKYFCEYGKFQVGDKIIREAESKEKFGWLTVSEILMHSSNVGSTKIAFDIGDERLRQGLLDFGFGAKSGVDLPGEARGVVQALPWRQHLLANISFGQGISANALQVANAYATIANGGELHAPYIVKSIRDPETGDEKKFGPKTIRRVLSAEDAGFMRYMLYQVTSPDGTGMAARVSGFPVGGKTGTAQKVNPKGRGYLPHGYISSFGGFIPVNEPKFVIYVAVDHPKKNSYYGAQVAAPVFSHIASYAVRKAGLAPVLLGETNANEQKIDRDLKKKSALRGLASKDTTTNSLLKNQNEIKQQEAAAGAQIEVMPDFHNLTAREVIRRSQSANVIVRMRGQGVVAETIPSAGAPLPADKHVQVILK